jgi:hypothetical protein
MPQQIVDGVLKWCRDNDMRLVGKCKVMVINSNKEEQFFPNACHHDRKRSTGASNIIQIPWLRVQRSPKTRQTMGKCPRQNQESPISSKTFKVTSLQERRIAQCVQQLCSKLRPTYLASHQRRRRQPLHNNKSQKVLEQQSTTIAITNRNKDQDTMPNMW